MNFSNALKYTDAAARIARLMAALAVLCREASTATGILSVQARTLWLLSKTQTTAPHHVASRVAEVVRLSDYLLPMEVGLESFESVAAAIRGTRDTLAQLLAIVDEVQAAMDQPSTGQRRERK